MLINFTVDLVVGFLTSVCPLISYTVCPSRYRTRHFFNNSNTNEDIAMKFEQEYVRCVRNEKECVCSAPNCCDTEQRSASQPEMPGLVASGTHGIMFRFRRKIQNKIYIYLKINKAVFIDFIIKEMCLWN